MERLLLVSSSVCACIPPGCMLANKVLLKAHPAATPFLRLIQRLSQQARLAGCLLPTRRVPPGASAGEIPPSLSEAWTSQGAWHRLLDLPAQHAASDDVDTQMHTSASTHHSFFADSGVLRCTLLNFSPSPPSVVLPLLWQKLLAHLPPAITLLLSLQLPSVFFSSSLSSFRLVKFLTSNLFFFFFHCTCLALVHIYFYISLSSHTFPWNPHTSSPCWSCWLVRPARPALSPAQSFLLTLSTTLLFQLCANLPPPPPFLSSDLATASPLRADCLRSVSVCVCVRMPDRRCAK